VVTTSSGAWRKRHILSPQTQEHSCHAIWITMNGIHIIENQYLEELAQDRVYEFAWSFNPLPLVGATGSPGNSAAIAYGTAPALWRGRCAA
jgi:hypothetical protein